jgi:phosphoribosylamine--glycine ligase
VVVVVASAGYPGAPRVGDVVAGAEADGILHAGTARGADGQLRSAGGRVLACTGTGPTLAVARERAYDLVRMTTLDGGQYRSDIALAAVEDRAG